MERYRDRCSQGKPWRREEGQSHGGGSFRVAGTVGPKVFCMSVFPLTGQGFTT